MSVVYHNISWISSNEQINKTNRTIYEPAIVLKCFFNKSVGPGTHLYYKVDWYLKNGTIIQSSTINETEIGQTFLSLMDLFAFNQTAGSNIYCSVGVTENPQEEPCKKTVSPYFYAGIKINNTSLNLLRKGRTEIVFYFTIPYVVKTVVVNGRTQPLPPLAVHIFPQDMDSDCKGYIGLDKCVVEINAFPYNERKRYESNEWKQLRNITLYHIDTVEYEIEASMTIRLTTSSVGDMFWHKTHQDISVTVTDYAETWKGKSCGSKTDPHIHTFDGVSYENHIPGEFILYRNTLYNQEVQTRHKQCHPTYNFPQCTCAVSVQSGQDVFLIDVCGDIQFIDFLSCNESVIQVFKMNDKLYKISLPTGTYVMVSLVEWPVRGSWQIDIDIYPSLSDVKNTAGLCGILDGSQENDLTKRNGSRDSLSLTFPDGFSNSWRVLDGENILKNPLDGRQRISSTLDKICKCGLTVNHCSYSTFSHCSNGPEKEFHCVETSSEVQLSRKKREISLERTIDTSNFKEKENVIRERRSAQNNVTSKEDAETMCISAFERSEPYKTCREHVSDLSGASFSNCIKDVIMTGDVNITAVHVGSAIYQCVNFISSNSTLQTTSPVVAKKLQALCPSNCSGQGVCYEGNCTCEVGFGGSDCSFDILSPPTFWSITPSAICDLSSQSCSRVYFRGRYFLENVEKTCFITKQSFSYDGSLVDVTEQESRLIEDNLFQGSCPLPKTDVTGWVSKLMLNVSYDRKQFTETLSFFTFRSECQQHSVENGNYKFTLKEQFCFINNACVSSAVSNPDNPCEVCNFYKDKYQWTIKQDCVTPSTPKPSQAPVSSLVFIVPAVVLSLTLLVAVIITIGVWINQKYKNDHDNECGDKDWRRFFPDHFIPGGSRLTDQTFTHQ